MTEVNLSSVFQMEALASGFINGYKRGLCADQDLVYFGSEAEYKWGVVIDCHGTNRFKNLLETFDWKTIMAHAEPDIKLIELVRAKRGTYGKDSGCMLILLKIFSGSIHTYCLGDSRVAIYKNGERVYVNCPHNRLNPLEIERLKNLRVEFEWTKDPLPHISSSTIMRGQKQTYSKFYNEYGALLCKIAPTQALGHNEATGYQFEKHIETFTFEDDMRVVAGSDGFYDMFLLEGEVAEDVEQDRVDITTMSVEQLLQKAENRWKQSWNYHWNKASPEMMFETVFPHDSYDDLSLVIWDNKRAV